MLVAAHGETVSLSLAHKRWSQGETGKVVIEDVRRTAPFRAGCAHGGRSLVSRQPRALRPARRDLFALYQGWLDRVAALEAAQITGTFAPPDSADRASALRDGLDTHARLQRDIAALRAQAEKEKQLNRRVELNLEIKRLEAELARSRRGTLNGSKPMKATEAKLLELPQEVAAVRHPDLPAHLLLDREGVPAAVGRHPAHRVATTASPPTSSAPSSTSRRGCTK